VPLKVHISLMNDGIKLMMRRLRLSAGVTLLPMGEISAAYLRKDRDEMCSKGHFRCRMLVEFSQMSERVLTFKQILVIRPLGNVLKTPFLPNRKSTFQLINMQQK
jgi:hypothetical protein